MRVSAAHVALCTFSFNFAAYAPGTAEPLFIVGMVWGRLGPIHIFV